ncbi:saccharopine dehydrogenase (NADP+, L-glutamate-forming) [Brettanomyces bruxellensis]|uniref:Saccharopine dehydrogenase [NADP(+), L-glutamate-forming] n=1 Tax=Dekkera bruxellensis TaxID=5007 RepID=A0A3F2Y252_DEKBR|nr:saccharopine dehydrogenase (NADP+, L-glutamate-forming) [Brettanomyces bruxellensis]KAF6014995.1 saccharopine dehydrogenase (NADP+, L-glutamate-forming) [Brettanomyces bruxellensis]VUG18418.1 LYS9 [Brettanomyces bruxellensis]
MATKKVLLLGSGFVAQPTIDILSKEADVELTIGCRHPEDAKKLAHENNKIIAVDATKQEELNKIVAQYDLAISLIPYIYHTNVVKAGIAGHTDVVTTSYISDAMRALEPEIKKAGIVVMNEIGLDPGIDHLYAVRAIHEAHSKGGKVTSFISFCGGLPAPEDSDNPLGYKFSWSARGVLLALQHTAHYYKDGKLVEVPAKELMASAKPYLVYPGYALTCYPNRDSTQYKELYNIPEAKTCIRGTLRFQGFCEFVQVLVDLGFLKDEANPIFQKPIAWKDALSQYIGAKSNSAEDILAKVDTLTKYKNETDKERAHYGLKWLGMLSDTKIHPRGNALDALCATMEDLMQLGPKERDLVILQHKFGIEYPDGKKETRLSTLIDYGIPGGYTSMARTVGIPCAVACKFVLKHAGVFAKPGLYRPLTPEISEPLLEALKKDYGIYLVEKTL